MISALFSKFVGKNRVKKIFWGWIPGNLPYFQCSMLTCKLATANLIRLPFTSVLTDGLNYPKWKKIVFLGGKHTFSHNNCSRSDISSVCVYKPARLDKNG